MKPPQPFSEQYYEQKVMARKKRRAFFAVIGNELPRVFLFILCVAAFVALVFGVLSGIDWTVDGKKKQEKLEARISELEAHQQDGLVVHWSDDSRAGAAISNVVIYQYHN